MVKGRRKRRPFFDFRCSAIVAFVLVRAQSLLGSIDKHLVCTLRASSKLCLVYQTTNVIGDNCENT